MGLQFLVDVATALMTRHGTSYFRLADVARSGVSPAVFERSWEPVCPAIADSLKSFRAADEDLAIAPGKEYFALGWRLGGQYLTFDGVVNALVTAYLAEILQGYRINLDQVKTIAGTFKGFGSACTENVVLGEVVKLLGLVLHGEKVADLSARAASHQILQPFLMVNVPFYLPNEINPHDDFSAHLGISHFPGLRQSCAALLWGCAYVIRVSGNGGDYGAA